jgi:hypothetical protein
MTNCYECDNCVYIGEGDYFCDKVTYALVIENWLPSTGFGGCKNEKNTD